MVENKLFGHGNHIQYHNYKLIRKNIVFTDCRRIDAFFENGRVRGYHGYD